MKFGQGVRTKGMLPAMLTIMETLTIPLSSNGTFTVIRIQTPDPDPDTKSGSLIQF